MPDIIQPEIPTEFRRQLVSLQALNSCKMWASISPHDYAPYRAVATLFDTGEPSEFHIAEIEQRINQVKQCLEILGNPTKGTLVAVGHALQVILLALRHEGDFVADVRREFELVKVAMKDTYD